MADYPGAAPPPEGVTPDMENPHDSLRTVLYVTQAVTLLFVTLFIGMRVYAKAYLLRNTASWDDGEPPVFPPSGTDAGASYRDGR